MKERSQRQARSIRRSKRAQPTAGRRFDKNNGNERTQQQGQSGQETKTAKVSLSGEVRPGNLDRWNERSEGWQRNQRTTRGEAAQCRARNK